MTMVPTADATVPVAVSVSAGPAARAVGSALLSGPGWAFVPQTGEGWRHCSGRKRYRFGMFVRRGFAVPAVVLCFTGGALDFGVELASLARLGMIGVGPAHLAHGELALEDGCVCPAIVEQDVGVSLFDALCGTSVPGGRAGMEGRPLAAPGTPGRAVENAKIAFDIACQLKAMHDAGLYHRDARPANVCVRRHGDAPQDIRATLIDFELSADVHAGAPGARSIAYWRELFGGAPVPPTPLVQDMGYFTLMCRELEAGFAESVPRTVANSADVPAYLGGACRSLFWYDRFGNARARRLSAVRDLDVLAESAGLEHVADHAFANDEVAELAGGIVRHGGYLDAADRELVARDPDCLLATVRERMARSLFASYQEDVRASGKTPEYENFEDQPEDLIESSYNQAAGVVWELREAGFEIVELPQGGAGEPPAGTAGRLVDEFKPGTVEQIAELEHQRWYGERLAQGWTYGPVKDAVLRKNPIMLPFAELGEDVREWNRNYARRLPRLLRESGFGIVEVRQ